MTVAGAVADDYRAMQAELLVSQRLGGFRQRVPRRDDENIVHGAEHFPRPFGGRRRFIDRPENNIRAVVGQFFPRARKGMVGKVKPGLRVLGVERVDQRQQRAERERVIQGDSQIPLPTRAELYRLFFQIFGGVQQQPALLQHHSAGIGKFCPVPGAIQQGDIQIVFQLLNHVAQRGRGFK